MPVDFLYGDNVVLFCLDSTFAGLYTHPVATIRCGGGLDRLLDLRHD